MRVELCPAFVLHRRSFGNNGLLLELFTRQDGRVAAIARGASSGRKPTSGLLQPFNALLVGWSGRGEVKTLTRVEADTEQGQYRLRGKSLYCGFYLNELVMRLTQRQDELPELFHHYGKALAALVSGDDLESVLRHFEINMLRTIGYGMLLDTDADSGKELNPDTRYHYQVELGPRQAMGDINANSCVHGATLLKLGQGTALEDKERDEARNLMRRVLRFYLGDKPLKSRELFRGQ